jgi:hypothetical protein
MKSESVQVEICTLSFCSFDAGVRVVIASAVCEATPKPRFGDCFADGFASLTTWFTLSEANVLAMTAAM